MKRLSLALLFLAVLALGACMLMPDGMAIRGPIWNSILGSGIDAPTDEVVEQRIRAADGYSVALWADGVPNARFLRMSPGGSLLVSQPRLGQILHVLSDADGDGRSDGQRVLVGDLDRPHGLEIRDGFLYVGEGSAIARIPIRESGLDTIQASGEIVRIATDIPEGGNHWARTLRFGPDGRIYLHVGSSCNVCVEEDERRGTILQFEADGSGERIFASGLRNATGFDWRPETGEMFATDNGRDLLGDDYPPCELNLIVDGGFYGWPYANGDNKPDPDFGEGQAARIATSIPPAHHFRAHNAPLGITFLRHQRSEDQGAALAALHGSWNRSQLDGYKVVSLHFRNGAIEERDFLTGFEADGNVIGRPVDVHEGPDGTIFVSDDYAGVIYRIQRGDAAGQSPSSAGSQALQRPMTDPPLVLDDILAPYEPGKRARLTADGEALFDTLACGTCHLASDAAPGIAVKELRGLGRRFTVASLSQFFLAPQPPMPVFDLPEEDREALAVYLMSKYAHP